MEEDKNVNLMMLLIFIAMVCIALASLILIFGDRIDSLMEMNSTSKIENREDLSTGFSEREVLRYGR